jgi:2-oxo-4-hydroxy-4-carboxy-5-ureidoimidazoline decarboxylase
MMTLGAFNHLDADAARNVMVDCNASEVWCTHMAAHRPYGDLEELKEQAQSIWQSLGEKDYLQAFTAHPMIGDVESLRKKFASTKAIAASEQAGAATADEQTLNELAQLNKAYQEKFGFIFIVFATGKSAAEMLSILKARLANSRPQEVQNAAAEQLKITLLRIDKLFG